MKDYQDMNYNQILLIPLLILQGMGQRQHCSVNNACMKNYHQILFHSFLYMLCE